MFIKIGPNNKNIRIKITSSFLILFILILRLPLINPKPKINYKPAHLLALQLIPIELLHRFERNCCILQLIFHCRDILPCFQVKR